MGRGGAGQGGPGLAGQATEGAGLTGWAGRAVRLAPDPRQAVIVSVPLANPVANVASGRVAGLRSTEPLVLNCDPWHGQMNVVPETLVMTQPSCVHTALNAENAWSEMRVTRNEPSVDCTSAVPPTDASAVPAPTVTLMVRLSTVPESAGSADPPPDVPVPLGDVAEPLHPCSTEPTATNDIA